MLYFHPEITLSSKQKEMLGDYFWSYAALSATLPSVDENQCLETFSVESDMKLKKYGFHPVHCFQGLNKTCGDEKAAKDWLLLNIDFDDISPKFNIVNNIPIVNMLIPSDIEMLKRFIIGGFPLNEMRYAIKSNKITNKDETLCVHFIFKFLPGFDFLREFWKILAKNFEEVKKLKKKCEENKRDKKKSKEKSNTNTVESKIEMESEKDKDNPVNVKEECVETVEVNNDETSEQKNREVKIDCLEDISEMSFSSESREVLLEIRNNNSAFYEELLRIKLKHQEVCLMKSVDLKHLYRWNWNY
jgi:hypothetical protein